MVSRKRKITSAATPERSQERDIPRRFELAQLTKLAPEMIVSKEVDDDFSMLMLALALVFNDLKGLMLLYEPFHSMRPPDGELTPHSGEWHGLDIQLYRLRIGVVHELLNLLHQFENSATGPQMDKILKKVSKKTRSKWTALVGEATGKPEEGTFAKTLCRIRNSVVFHYHQPKDLRDGYRRHFFQSAKNQQNEHAYGSFGKNMERTRYFYVDAAVQAALMTLHDRRNSGNFLKELVAVTKATNETLASILEEYSRPARRH